MKPRTLGVLALPALVLAAVSCNEANETPVAPSAPSSPQAPALGRGLDPSKVRVPAPSAASLAAASQETVEMAPVDPGLAATSGGDLAPHDPTPVGMRVECIDGSEGTGGAVPNGEAYRFKNNKGCELNTFDGDADPSNNAAFVVTTQNRLRGKKLTQIQRLDFYFAGGPPVGGSPRWSLPVDLAPTDGATDGYAFIDVVGCNDGDGYVGALRGDDDGTCSVAFGADVYANFSAFEAAYPDARVARDAVPFIALDQPGHYLIYRVNAF